VALTVLRVPPPSLPSRADPTRPSSFWLRS
jgi:hypothetical protein